MALMDEKQVGECHRRGSRPFNKPFHCHEQPDRLDVVMVYWAAAQLFLWPQILDKYCEESQAGERVLIVANHPWMQMIGLGRAELSAMLKGCNFLQSKCRSLAPALADYLKRNTAPRTLGIWDRPPPAMLEA